MLEDLIYLYIACLISSDLFPINYVKIHIQNLDSRKALPGLYLPKVHSALTVIANARQQRGLSMSVCPKS